MTLKNYIMSKYRWETSSKVRQNTSTLSIVVRCCNSCSAITEKVSSIVPGRLWTMYFIFGLFGDSDTMRGLCIPKTLQIAFLVVLVAVAVSAIQWT